MGKESLDADTHEIGGDKLYVFNIQLFLIYYLLIGFYIIPFHYLPCIPSLTIRWFPYDVIRLQAAWGGFYSPASNHSRHNISIACRRLEHLFNHHRNSVCCNVRVWTVIFYGDIFMDVLFRAGWLESYFGPLQRHFITITRGVQLFVFLKHPETDILFLRPLMDDVSRF